MLKILRVFIILTIIVIYDTLPATFSHPERLRDRPVDTSATAKKLVPNPAGHTRVPGR
jgi:hypothetical protein